MRAGQEEAFDRLRINPHRLNLAAIGFRLPGGTWDSAGAWGWDFPLIAMTAARLGRPRDAVDALLMDVPKNTWLPNGHNPQVPRADLPVYLPANGSLLLAAAMMAAGWDGAPAAGRPGSHRAEAPGFPADGSWSVRVEGILPIP